MKDWWATRPLVVRGRVAGGKEGSALGLDPAGLDVVLVHLTRGVLRERVVRVGTIEAAGSQVPVVTCDLASGRGEAPATTDVVRAAAPEGGRDVVRTGVARTEVTAGTTGSVAADLHGDGDSTHLRPVVRLVEGGVGEDPAGRRFDDTHTWRTEDEGARSAHRRRRRVCGICR